MGMTGRSSGKRQQTLDKACRQVSGWNSDEDLAFALGQQFLESEVTFAFNGAPIAGRKQPTEPTVGRTIGRIADCFEAIRADEPRTNEYASAIFLRCLMRADDTGQGIAIGNTDGGMSQFGSLRHHLVRM